MKEMLAIVDDTDLRRTIERLFSLHGIKMIRKVVVKGFILVMDVVSKIKKLRILDPLDQMLGLKISILLTDLRYYW